MLILAECAALVPIRACGSGCVSLHASDVGESQRDVVRTASEPVAPSVPARLVLRGRAAIGDQLRVISGVLVP